MKTGISKGTLKTVAAANIVFMAFMVGFEVWIGAAPFWPVLFCVLGIWNGVLYGEIKGYEEASIHVDELMDISNQSIAWAEKFRKDLEEAEKKILTLTLDKGEDRMYE